MIIDAHVHLFTPKIIANVSAKSGMVAELHLQTDEATQRIGTAALGTALGRAGAHAALMLPTASADGVSKINRDAIDTAADCNYLNTAGTLHPECKDLQAELAALHASGIRAIKLCSFSQGFMLNAPDTIRYLPAADNLYLDTSNAAHTLNEAEFIRLLEVHGPNRILFGTDWPWFDPGKEILLIEGLLDRAGYTINDKAKVFGGNIAELLAIDIAAVK